MPIVVTLGLLLGSAALGTALGYDMLVTLLMVLATAAWVFKDAGEVGFEDRTIVLGVLLLWIFCFPYYLYKRRELLLASAVSERLAADGVMASNDMRRPESLGLHMQSASRVSGAGDRAERACPECGETVLAVARKCKHCGSAIEPIAEASTAVSPPTVAEGPQAVPAEPRSMGAALGRPVNANEDEGGGSGVKKIFIGVAVAFGAIGLLAWFASSYDGKSGDAGAGSSIASSAASGTATVTAPALAVGDLITTSKFGIKVTTVGTPDTVGIELMAESPAEGGKYVAVQWEYQNISAKPIGPFSQPRLFLADPSGTRYEADVGASGMYAMQLDLTEKVLSDLNPGIKVRAASVFEVAESFLARPGWTIVIDADRKVEIPLSLQASGPSAAVASEAPVVPEQAAVEEVPALPDFAAYAAAIYDGDLYAADWMTESESGEWSDQLGKPMDQPDVNFAGRYYIGLHSCGTGCRYYTMTDLSTGRSLNELVARFAALEERPTMDDGREYLTDLVGQADSSLLIAQYHIEAVTEATNECREQAFVLEGESLRPISDVRKGCSEQ